ncbi:hypothetical protein DPMN_172359 [Dreissena polymorpha]|uniref:Uncharacterized protein n=1 Tax=Dreissena polymorpha TaxID=45954 RepID=A0A9D4E2S4_DREPO|nr:hypothetical protein DPMN_172359 [Dreissena polymorpha]
MDLHEEENSRTTSTGSKRKNPSCTPTWLSAKTLENIVTKKKNEIGPTAVEQEQKQQKHKKSTHNQIGMSSDFTE